MAIHKGKIRQRNSGGTYDYLLPETTIDMVNGLHDELNGKVSEIELAEVDGRLNGKIDSIFINVKDFGAIGDGIVDDYSVIQQAIDHCLTNDELVVYFPEGTYLISKPLLVQTKRENNNVHWWDGKGIKLLGHDKSTTKIVKYTNDTLNDVHPEVNGKDSTIILFSGIRPDGTKGGSGTGIGVKNLYIENQSSLTGAMGITGRAGQRMELDNLNISSYSGMILDTPFSSTFTNIVFRCTDTAIQVSGGATSNTFRTIYAPGCNNPYKIHSAYSSLDLVYADNCTGTVFDVGGMSMLMKNCGTESPKAQYIVKASGTAGAQIYITTLFIHRQTGDPENGLSLEDCAVFTGNRSIKVDDLAILENVAITGNSYLATATNLNDSSSFDIGRILYNKNFIGTSNPKLMLYKQRSNSTSTGAIRVNGTSILTRRNDIMPYLGVRNIGEYISNAPIDKAIYLDNEDKFNDSRGNNLQYQSSYRKGDVLLLNDPKNKNALGLVVTDIGAGTSVNNNTFAEIPINLVGSTAQRPTQNLYVGLEYKDTTLQKTITWWGTSWKDAIGTVV